MISDAALVPHLLRVSSVLASELPYLLPSVLRPTFGSSYLLLCTLQGGTPGTMRLLGGLPLSLCCCSTCFSDLSVGGGAEKRETAAYQATPAHFPTPHHSYNNTHVHNVGQSKHVSKYCKAWTEGRRAEFGEGKLHCITGLTANHSSRCHSPSLSMSKSATFRQRPRPRSATRRPIVVLISLAV